MVSFKCKMCGGSLEIPVGTTVVECEYCATQQTLPKLDDDKRMSLYDRANHFRRNNEFDKAMGIYEKILNEDNTDAEAYWSLVLCRYGIEYVEDPASHKRVPTVNRAQYTSIFDDSNYKSALKYADSYQRMIYEKEAKAINEIQKGILAISQNEEPFDIFICYKESDNSGRRTHDSVLAQDLYYQLTQEGFKVFFARITLEDKLGSAYEPYIFAALNSAKVMVVLGTKSEFFNAVWVKNEWSRYLALIKQGQKKMLIPAYKDMDPYDLPEEFSHLQAQDMSKLGFMQDLIRGIKKIVVTEEPKTTVIKETVVSSAVNSANIQPLIKRAFMFVEDENWSDADEYCEKVLDIDPEYAEAYFCKLLVEKRVKTKEMLKDLSEPFENSSNYQKMVRFSNDDALKSTLAGYIKHIKDRNAKDEELEKQQYIEETYDEALFQIEVKQYEKAKSLLDTIPSTYKDTASLMKSLEKDIILEKAIGAMQDDAILSCEMAAKMLKSIPGWKNADELLGKCMKKIADLKEAARLRKEKEEREAELARIREEEARLQEQKRNRKKSLMVKCFLIYIAIGVIGGIIFYALPQALGASNLKDLIKSVRVSTIYNQQIDGEIEKGGYVKFGKYEQDDNTSNGKEDIEWFVLDVQDDKALVVSKYSLDRMPHEEGLAMSGINWEQSDIRAWLNSDFIDAAFSSSDKEMISPVTLFVPEKKSEDDKTDDDSAQDKVFLLSESEVKSYLKERSERVCKHGKESKANIIWWLRPTSRSGDCPVVDSEGVIGQRDIYYQYAVRPALWINLKP